jgi:uncharacterized membrane protein YdbT with pleckstrin-like domain
MKRTIATLIAGLFATAAFAQTPVAVKAETKTEVKAAKVDAKETKQEAKTEVKEAKADAKQQKKVARHHPMVKADTTVAATTTTTSTTTTPAPAAK